MEATVRDFVRRRAGNRCEYCRLRQEHLPFSTFHIGHIIPRKYGDTDELSNLALACDRCNASKGSNLTGIDPATGALILPFNPRVHAWDEHFVLSDVTLVGVTATGCTTVRVLNMNDARRLRLRTMLKQYEQL